MSARRSQRLLEALFTTEEMRAIFSDHGRLQGMLDFEAALARSESRVGLVPDGAAVAIAAQCRADSFNVDALASAAALAGNLAIPLVRELTAQVAERDVDAARYVHWGATSQDVIDTGLVLQLRSALASIDADLARLSDALASLAQSHARTLLAGRTWLQQGPPVTLGLKAAGWLSAVERHRRSLKDARAQVATLQFGGAVGTLAALDKRGLEVAAALAQELKLALPDLPWHTQRDRFVAVATHLGIIVGTLGKIARDVSLLMQTEVAEAFEPTAPGRGGSSTMPHKRNPVHCAVILSAATRVPGLVSAMLAAMVQEHERGLGGWHAEWETLPEICRLAGGALAQAIAIVGGLRVDAQMMAANLEATRGLIMAEAVSMALAHHIGRQPAHELVEHACAQAVRDNKHLREVLAADARVTRHLSGGELDRALDPGQYIGEAEQLVARALAARRVGPSGGKADGNSDD